MKKPHDCDVIIIGGGLTGLTAALLLHQAGQSIVVIEAAARPGGRIRSLRAPVSGAYLADFGPTWIWPEAQPLAADWLARLNLETYAQFDMGDTIVEQNLGMPPIRYPLSGMYGSHRIKGGTEAIIARLLEKLPANIVRASTRATSVSLHVDVAEVTTNNAAHPVLRARRVIAAMPLRVAATSIAWSPPLDDRRQRAMMATPTWMAPQAKAVAVYARPFWRARGLSGRIASRIGPLTEAHDHSGPDGTPAAIFGFVGWPQDTRRKLGPALKDQIVAQLIRCFGDDARHPIQCEIEDWAKNELVSTSSDLSAPQQHPELAHDHLRQPHGNNGAQVYFAIAETSAVSPGLIEGAFDAGQTVALSVAATF